MFYYIQLYTNTSVYYTILYHIILYHLYVFLYYIMLAFVPILSSSKAETADGWDRLKHHGFLDLHLAPWV